MFEEISSKEAKQTLMFIFDAAVDIEMEKDQTIFVEKVLKHARRIF